MFFKYFFFFEDHSDASGILPLFTMVSKDYRDKLAEEFYTYMDHPTNSNNSLIRTIRGVDVRITAKRIAKAIRVCGVGGIKTTQDQLDEAWILMREGTPREPMASMYRNLFGEDANYISHLEYTSMEFKNDSKNVFTLCQLIFTSAIIVRH